MVVQYNLSEPTNRIGVNFVGDEIFQMKNDGVVSTLDLEYGYVSYFEPKTYLLLPVDIAPKLFNELESRTFVYWIKLPKLGGEETYIHRIGDEGTFSVHISGGVLVVTVAGKPFKVSELAQDKWYHVAITHEKDTMVVYLNGKAWLKEYVEMVKTEEHLVIGHKSDTESTVYMLIDFRVYGKPLVESDVTYISKQGPLHTTFFATEYTHILDLSWDLSMRGVSAQSLLDVSNNTTIPQSSNTSFEYHVSPGTTYEFKLFDDSSELGVSLTSTTPPVSRSTVQDLMIRIGRDTSVLSDEALEDISEFYMEFLETGDSVTLPDGKPAKLVKNAETLPLPSKATSVLTSFSSTGGAGQSFSIDLGDSSSVTLGYNPENNSVQVGSEECRVEEYIVVGGFKVNVREA